MGTSLGMAEESANALIQFVADDVLELAGLSVHFVFFDCESVFEKTLRKAMPADNIAGSTTAG